MTESEAADGAPATPADAEAAAAAAPATAEELARAEARAQENWNKYLRTVAELDNVRKRATREVEQARKFGLERLAAELLVVLDSLEMGLDAGSSASAESLLEGKKATLRLLKAVLGKFGVTEISPVGESFDPQFHEALSVQPASAGEPAGSVLTVIQKGYQLNGRLLRPARVVVAGAAPEAQPQSDCAADKDVDA